MRAIVFVVGLSMVLLSTAVLADVPGLINYQGTLTDSSGTALDTTVSITLSIYTDSTGGTVVWSETQSTVDVSNGIFNVLLGRVNAIPDTVFKSTSRWLGIRAGIDPELQPRQRIASVGYAFEAAEADSADYARNAFAVSDSDWTISGSNMYSAVPGSVGIGTASPAGKLHVAGNAKIDGTGKMTGFMMPTGASDGYVLTSDPAGVGTWQAPAVAVADSDWIITGTDMYSGIIGNVGIGTPSPAARLEVLATSSAAVWGESQTGSGVFGFSSSGEGVSGMSTNGFAGGFSGGLGVYVVNSQDIGLQIHDPINHGIHVVNAQKNGVQIDNAADNGIEITNPGGPGVRVDLGAGNDNNGIYALVQGLGAAVRGENSDEVGVYGTSNLGAGVEGGSTDGIGVEGSSTNSTGVKGWSHSNVGYGVHGVNDSEEGDGIRGESFGGDGVYGFSENGTGVAGDSWTEIGVYGISIESTAVMGWSEQHIAVFGQSDTVVGVWGESFHKVGVVGTAGQPLGLSSLADSAGVYGHSDISYGVIGVADLQDSSKAGVRAVGDGVDAPGNPRAAALEIRDGAVKVSGQNRPAGTLYFTPAWSPEKDQTVTVTCDICECKHAPHEHIYHYVAGTVLINSLIVPDSIILLTVETPTPEPDDPEPTFAQVVTKNPGVANIMVTCVTRPEPPEGEIQVHYLIINPFPPGQ